jgi:translation initiation factor 1
MENENDFLKCSEGTSSIIMNLSNNPFGFDDDIMGEIEDLKKNKELESVHIRIQQRNGRKSITTIQGLPNNSNYNEILKKCKKKFNCNGHVAHDNDMGQIIQLQGDQRQKILRLLIDDNIVDKDIIKMHGF